MRGDGIKAKLRLDCPLSCWRDGNRTDKTLEPGWKISEVFSVKW